MAVLILVGVSCTGNSSSAARPPSAGPRFAESGVVPITGLASRQAPAVAWSGRELLVFGGYRAKQGDRRDWRRDGALVDVETGAARKVASAPFAAPLYAPAATRTGHRIAVAGTECAGYEVEEDSDNFSCARRTGRIALATLDPATARWSRATRVPESAAPRSSPSWAAGRSVPGAYVTQLLGADGARTVVALDGRGGRSYWVQARPGARLRALPDPQAASDGCISGRRLVVAATEPESATDWSLRTLDLAAPRSAWEGTPPVALGAGFRPAIACMGGRVMLSDRFGVAGTAGARVYDLAGRTWTEAATPPANQVTTADGRTVDAPFFSDPAQRLWTGSELVELTDFRNPDNLTFPRSRAFDPVANSWRRLGSLPAPMNAPQWAGTAAVDFTTTRAGRSAVSHFVVR